MSQKRTPKDLLYNAIRSGNMDGTQKFVKQVKLDKKYPLHWDDGIVKTFKNIWLNWLHYSVLFGKFEIFKYLVEVENVDCNIQSILIVSKSKYFWDDTPLHFAARLGKVEFIEYLMSLEGKLKKDVKNYEGKLAHELIDDVRIKALIETGSYPKEEEKDELSTKKIEEEEEQQAEEIEVEKPPGTPEKKIEKSKTEEEIAKEEMYEAIKKGNFEKVRELSGLVEGKKKFPLHFGDPDLKKYRKRWLNWLHYAVCFDRLEILKHLVEDVKLDVNMQTIIVANTKKFYFDDTSLHLAARNANLPIVKFLLSFGVNTSKKNHGGKTAYDVSRNEEVKKLLQFEEEMSNF